MRPATDSPGAQDPDWRAQQTEAAGDPRPDPSRPLRMAVRLRRRALDRQIAAGASLDNPARAMRAHQLAGPRERHLVAFWLEMILAAADERDADPASPLILNHTGVIGSRGQILSLIGLLRGTAPVRPRGVARARWLAESPHSPLIRTQLNGTLQTTLDEIVAELITG